MYAQCNPCPFQPASLLPTRQVRSCMYAAQPDTLTGVDSPAAMGPPQRPVKQTT